MTQDTLRRELATQAARWWRGQLDKPATSKFDNGCGLTGILGAFMVSQGDGESPQRAQLDEFERVLTDLLVTKIESYRLGRSVYLGTDYSPEDELYEAAQAAGILGTARFPMKTRSWLLLEAHGAQFRACEGYSGASTVVWQEGTMAEVEDA